MNEVFEKSQNSAKPKERNIGRKLMAGLLGVTSCLFLAGNENLPNVTELHHTDASSDIEDTITVMTANVHGWETTNGKDNFDIFLDTLETEKPDITCMQEVLADGPEIQKLFNEGYNVLFATTIWYPIRGRFGNAVISKSPLELKHVVDLPNPTTVTPRNALVFEVETSNSEIDMMNVHLSTNSQESEQQLNRLDALQGKHVQMACGDFNQQPKKVKSGPFGTIASPKMLNVSLETFPAHSPAREIDYVLPGCGIINNTATRTAYIGSDHLARIEEIDITGCPMGNTPN